MDRPPERIELPDVGAALRRHELSDLDALHAAIEASRDHLRPFMFWADQAREDTATFLRGAVAEWQAGSSFGYLIVAIDDDGDVLGSGGLHRRGGRDVLEVGYWRRADVTGRGVATGLARALTTAALDLPGIERVEIHCDVANTRSAAVPRRLGFTLVGMIEQPPRAPGESGRHQVWATSQPV